MFSQEIGIKIPQKYRGSRATCRPCKSSTENRKILQQSYGQIKIWIMQVWMQGVDEEIIVGQDMGQLQTYFTEDYFELNEDN